MRSLLGQSLLALAVVSVGSMPLQSPAQVSVSIGVGVGGDPNPYATTYPAMVQVPGYPVYYDPSSNSNYFFFDGLYWIYANDAWYQSSWYSGPWQEVDPYYVPEFLLRVPVRYYRQPPQYFRGWGYDEAPRWGYRWGNEWEHRRRGWNEWDRRAIVAPAPLPHYQREYYGERYPRSMEHQQSLHVEQYRYAPQDRMTHEHWQRPAQPQPRERREIVPSPNQPAPIQARPIERREIVPSPVQPAPIQARPPALATPPTPQPAQPVQPQPVQPRPIAQPDPTQRSAPAPRERGNSENREGGGDGGRGGRR